MGIYCTYLTVYTGNKLPPFYVGCSTLARIKQGYHGSVSSKKYKTIWKEELLNHSERFRSVVLTTHKTKEAAIEREHKFHIALQVASHPLYINQTQNKQPLNFQQPLKGSQHKLAGYYCFLSPEGDYYEGYGLKAFVCGFGLHPSAMADVNRGMRRQHKGWVSGNKEVQDYVLKTQTATNIVRLAKIAKSNTMRNKASAKEFKVVSPEGVVYEGKNIYEFCIVHKLDETCLSKVIRGIQQKHKGWRRS